MAKTKRIKIKSANLQLVKQSNLSLVFRLIYEKQPVSRAELAQITGLSPTTVSSLVDELIANSTVEEAGAGKTTTSGRKPIMLKVNPAGGYFVGAELLPEGFRLAAFDLNMRQVAALTRQVEDYSCIGGALAEGIEETMESLVGGTRRLKGICIGVPGVIEKGTGRVLSSTLIPIDGDNDFYDTVCCRFPEATVRLGNESSFCAYIEKVHMGRKMHSLVYVEVNDGIGAGIIVDDRIFTGAFGNAGELGHVSVDVNGAPCKCGNRGCLEATVNLPAIRKRFAQAMGANVSLSDARKALEAGDPNAMEALGEICRILAAGINNVINIVNPEAVVVGGGVTELGEPFLERLQEDIWRIGSQFHGQELTISLSAVSGDPVPQGCAQYLLDHALNQMYL